MCVFFALLGDQVYTTEDSVEAVETADRFRPDLVLMWTSGCLA